MRKPPPQVLGMMQQFSPHHPRQCRLQAMAVLKVAGWQGRPVIAWMWSRAVRRGDNREEMKIFLVGIE